MLALLLTLTLACSLPPPAGQVMVTNGVSSAVVTDYGNGVYYIAASGAYGFGNALSAFIKDHPDLKVVAVAGDGTGGGYDKGYFIITRPAGDCD